jgi:acyl-CoA thioester hydrolase
MKQYGPFNIRISDINYGGHMGNDRALSLFHDARILFLEEMGFSEKKIGENIGIILTKAEVEYKREVFLHDDLVATVARGEIRSRSFELIYSFNRECDGAEVFKGKTVLVAYNYYLSKTTQLPGPFVEELRSS